MGNAQLYHGPRCILPRQLHSVEKFKEILDNGVNHDGAAQQALNLIPNPDVVNRLHKRCTDNDAIADIDNANFHCTRPADMKPLFFGKAFFDKAIRAGEVYVERTLGDKFTKRVEEFIFNIFFHRWSLHSPTELKNWGFQAKILLIIQNESNKMNLAQASPGTLKHQQHHPLKKCTVIIIE